MNEAETRAEHIDPALKASGWGIVDGSRVRRIRRDYMISRGRIEGHVGGHSCPPPLTLIYSCALLRNKTNSKIKTSGQECPLYIVPARCGATHNQR